MIPLSKKLAKKYSVKRNTYVRKLEDDSKNKVEAEIGDVEQDAFFPQLKIKRWDNEANFSLRLQDKEQDSPVISVLEEVIKWKKQNIEAHFYEKPKGVLAEHGAYEFEILLKKKPASNKLEFSIETKGLSFHKQPMEAPKTGRRKNMFIPENVKGSYVVKLASRPINIKGGMKYKNNKFSHILRPKLIDANGNEKWAELDIDVEKKLLKITTDERWLDNATYPVVVDPTFGITDIGGSQDQLYDDNLQGSDATSPADAATATSISVYTEEQGSGDKVKGILVLGSNLNIVTNGIGPETDPPASFAWITSTFATPPTLAGSTGYRICIVHTGDALFKYDWVSNAGFYDDNNYASPTNPTGGDDTDSWEVSIYCTYVAVATSDIKSIAGVTQANIKSVASVTEANIKSIAGVSNV